MTHSTQHSTSIICSTQIDILTDRRPTLYMLYTSYMALSMTHTNLPYRLWVVAPTFYIFIRDSIRMYSVILTLLVRNIKRCTILLLHRNSISTRFYRWLTYWYRWTSCTTRRFLAMTSLVCLTVHPPPPPPANIYIHCNGGCVGEGERGGGKAPKIK